MSRWASAVEYNARQMAMGLVSSEQVAALVAWAQSCLAIEQDGKFGPATRLALAQLCAVEAGEVERFIAACESQAGKPYVFGAEVRLDDPDPQAFDCSELLQWAAHQAGLRLPDGTWNQVAACRDAGTLIDVDTALATRGALLFKFRGDPFGGTRPEVAHVAVSLGNGETIEALRPDVRRRQAHDRGWTHAALIPLLERSAGPA